MILGYIVTEKKLKNIDGFVEQVDDISLADSTKPILIVGWKKAKEHPKYSTILEKQLDEHVYWTFSKSESRSDFEDDLKNFYNIIYNNILNNIKYYYVNIFKLNYNKIKKLINIVNSSNRKTIYISNGFIYIPYETNNILGISLKILEYCGINKDKIIDKIKLNPNNKIVEDDNYKAFKLSKELKNKKYALPYFLNE